MSDFWPNVQTFHQKKENMNVDTMAHERLLFFESSKKYIYCSLHLFIKEFCNQLAHFISFKYSDVTFSNTSEKTSAQEEHSPAHSKQGNDHAGPAGL